MFKVEPSGWFCLVLGLIGFAVDGALEAALRRKLEVKDSSPGQAFQNIKLMSLSFGFSTFLIPIT